MAKKGAAGARALAALEEAKSHHVGALFFKFYPYLEIEALQYQHLVDRLHY